MIIRYNIEKLEELLFDFYNVTQIQIVVVDTELNKITKPVAAPRSFCQRVCQATGSWDTCVMSDAAILEECRQTRRPVLHLCHAGLFDMAAPIVHPRDNIVMGYLLMGRCRQTTDFSQIANRVASYPGAYKEWEKDYMDLPYYAEATMRSAARLAVSMSISILQDNLIWLELDDLAEGAAVFISNHLSEDLSLGHLCAELNVSKNMLYNSFHRHFGCTVNEYIIKERIQKAKSLLRDSTLSVNQICEQVGFKAPPYFCKLFREQTGLTPLAYRKEKNGGK